MGRRDLGLGTGGSGFRSRVAGLGLILLLTYASLCQAAPQSSAPAQGGLKIVVRVYDYASTSSQAVRQAEEESSRIFHEAGVELTWLDCPTSQAEAEKHPVCDAPLDALPVDLRILPAAMAARLSSSREQAGFALPSGRAGSASAVWVFYLRVQELAASRVASEAQILGNVMAHEIGHILLGPHHHSPLGIMRAHWDRKYLEEASRGELYFTPDQAKLLRSNAQARAAPPTVIVTRQPVPHN